MAWASLWIAIGLLADPSGTRGPTMVHIPITGSGEVDLADVVGRLADRIGLAVDRPPGAFRLPIRGLAGSLTRRLLARTLGPDVALAVEPDELVVSLPPEQLEPDRLPDLERRLKDLADEARREAIRTRANYGMHALASYRPNDPSRPTICLVHGLNSTSEVFVHMVGPLQAAGFGVVVYDFSYNRDLDETARAFGRDWSEFRRRQGEARPWAIVAHSMGALLARWYVEADPAYAGDVSAMVLLAPPNQGSGLAKAQTLLQLVQGLKAVDRPKSHALARLSDGLGEAADDMMPGSAFLEALNGRPRRAGVRYHTLAGDVGFLTAAARAQLEAQLEGLGRSRGLFGGLARWAGEDLRARLDELTDGLGDGCVAVACTRLEGVDDHATIRANHLELIRAPLLFPEPGPVASMPFILSRLGVAGPAADGPGRP